MLRYYSSLSILAIGLLLGSCSHDQASVKQSLSESKWALQAVVDTKTGGLDRTKNTAVLTFSKTNALVVSTKSNRYTLSYNLDETNNRATISKANSSSDVLVKKISSIDNFELSGNCLRLIDSKSGYFFVFERTK